MEGKIKYIPPDIVFKFLLRLPVKSLLESRRVCKLWNEMIRSKPFIKSHVDHQKTASSSSDAVNRYLLTDYRGSFTAGLVQGESYQLLESSAYKLFDTFGETFYAIKARGICDGLLCLSCNDTYFLLNPILKIVFQVPMRDIQFDDVKGWQACSVCFGYHVDDYKVIEIHNAWPMYYLCIYSLNTNSWSFREFACPPNEFIGSDGEFVDGGSLIVNGVVYFVRHTEKGGVLVWFDLIRGTVTEMGLPENFKLTTKYIMEEYRGSIALIEYTLNDDRQSENDLSMWVLKLSDADASVVCHTKKFEAGTNYRCDPIGLIDNNKVVMMITDKTVMRYSRKYFLYDVETEYQHRFMAFEGKLEEHKEGPCPSRVNNFVESLVLLTIPTPYVLRKKGSYSTLAPRDQP